MSFSLLLGGLSHSFNFLIALDSQLTIEVMNCGQDSIIVVTFVAENFLRVEGHRLYLN